jgi:hypothetical protein
MPKLSAIFRQYTLRNYEQRNLEKDLHLSQLTQMNLTDSARSALATFFFIAFLIMCVATKRALSL